MSNTLIPIIINGNDGTGKTTLVQYFNSILNNKYYMLERSTGDNTFPEITKDHIKWLDNETLKYTWERDIKFKTDSIYRFVLNLEPETINKRIRLRDDPISPWDTPKAIGYFNQRFSELSYYYGYPLLNYENKTCEQISNEIIECIESGLYNTIRYLNLQSINNKFIQKHNLENYLIGNFDNILKPKISNYLDEIKSYFEEFNLFKLDDYLNLQNQIIIKWFLSQATYSYNSNRDKYIIRYKDIQIELDLDNIYFIKFTEGESKIIYKIISKYSYFDELVLITLKPTIYSHSKQATGEIEDLEKIRAQGTMIFMEMLFRNEITHVYKSINFDGIIISKFANTNQLELIFKRYCEGTDKHSYYGLKNVNQIVLESGEYSNSLYIRFDWRNPNHVIGGTSGINPNTHFCYYLIEEYEGKEQFFNKYLSKTNTLGIVPFGDKTINSDILENYANVNKIKESVIKIYATISSYLNKIGIEAKDGCFMIDSEGKYFWSEINQDCMRLKTLDSTVSYDKDIWRIGGSSQSNSIINKWTELNFMMVNYFSSNRFELTEMLKPNYYAFVDTLEGFLSNPKYTISNEYKNIYLKLINKYKTFNEQKRVLLTLDIYNQKPVLVQKGKVFESHAESVQEAFDKISLYPDILMVDLNGAIDKDKSVNREIIKKFGTSNYIHTGGGIGTIEDAQELLESSVRRIVIGSNTNVNFISQIPKSRLIVELSVNNQFEILIDGRKTNTHVHLKDKLKELALTNVEAISITFQETEGMRKGIPRDKLIELVQYIPKNIVKIFIAGGITTIDDLEFIWSFPKLIPQLGSAIWKNDISLGDLYCAMAKWDQNNLVTCVLQNKNGLVLGVVYMDREALSLTCKTKLLYRYSRQYKKVMCKGETSGNFQHVIKISFDCDNDSVLVIVDDSNPFCHTSSQSCFSNQTVIKANLNIINEHIANCNESNSKYVAKLKKYPGFNLLKINEEFWEILSNPNVHECSDFLIHFIIYLNSIGIKWDDICNELNARRWNPKLISVRQEKKNLVYEEKKLFLGITGTKYLDKTDSFILNELGIQMIKPEGRSLEIRYNIVDNIKYQKYFGESKVYFVNMKPKDMPYMVSSGTIDGAITYSSVILNQPDVFKPVCEIVDPDIELSLIKRKSDTIDINNWTEKSKCYIACEHMIHVYKYLTEELGISDKVFSTVHMLGSSESFLVNKSKTHYMLADAIVESGSTLKANNLEVWKIILEKGQVKIGLYLNKMIKFN